MDSLIPHGEPPRYFTFAAVQALGVPHATTTRHSDGIGAASDPGGPVQGGAARMLAELGLDCGRVAWARQVHGVDVARIESPGGFAGAADILVTSERHVPLAVMTADCLAITLCDTAAPALAVAHVGWRGTVRGGARSAIEALERSGGRRERSVATISPSIGPCCYEVDEPVVEAFSSAYPETWDRWFTAAGPGRWMLDLWSANEELLVSGGLDPSRILNGRLCTACRPDLLYSYRKGHRGRLLTVAALP